MTYAPSLTFLKSLAEMMSRKSGGCSLCLKKCMKKLENNCLLTQSRMLSKC